MSPENETLVVDKCKVNRARKRIRKNNLEKHLTNITAQEVKSFFFDGRKDKTRTNIGRQVITTVEEHISILRQPGSEYICHVTVKGGAEPTLTAIIAKLQALSIKYDNMCAVGCDGTPVNTGPYAGIVCLLEKHLQKPVHWFVCLLHANELPLRHLIKDLDGNTTGPTAWSGPIGRSITKDVWNEEIAQFNRIEFKCNIDNIDSVAASFSTDQKYLFNICKAISTGNFSEELAAQVIGNLSHSRWHTTASRLLRKYASSPKPSANLCLLAEYVVKVYAPMHFNIKAKGFCTFGARHVADLITLTRFLPPRALKIIDPVIMRNAFFAHSENVILAMLDDEREWIRQLGYLRILEARKINKSDPNNVRMFEIPQMYTDFDSYENMINWNETFYEPPMLRDIEINNENVVHLIKKKITQHEFASHLCEIPCHTQAVERCVQLVARAAANVSGEAAREGCVLTTLKSRKNMPQFQHKAQYKPTKSSDLPPKV